MAAFKHFLCNLRITMSLECTAVLNQKTKFYTDNLFSRNFTQKPYLRTACGLQRVKEMLRSNNRPRLSGWEMLVRYACKGSSML